MHDVTSSKPPAAASSSAKYRDARVGDARAIARLIEIAGEGIPGFLWSESAAPGQDPLDYGTERAAREGGAYGHASA